MNDTRLNRSIGWALFLASNVLLSVSAVFAILSTDWVLMTFALGTVALGLSLHFGLEDSRRRFETILDALHAAQEGTRVGGLQQLQQLTTLSTAVERNSTKLDTLSHSVGAGLTDKANELTSHIDGLGTKQQQGLKDVVNRTERIRHLVEELPSTADEYQRLHDRVAPDVHDLPQLGGWAITAPVVAQLARTIENVEGPCHVLEMGSGGSSVWMGLTLRMTGQGGHVWSLEHDHEYAAATRARVQALGLDSFITVVDAPIDKIQVGNEIFSWYDTSGLPTDLPPINILLVDGPPARLRPDVRYPALPLFASRLAVGAAIILDDYVRQGEQGVYRRWAEEFPGLEMVRNMGKGIALRWHPTPLGS